MSKYLNLAPKDLASQSAAFRKAYPTLASLPNEEFMLQPKYDGCNLIVFVTLTGGYALSRTGEVVRSVQHIVDEAIDHYPAGTVLFGEAYIEGAPFPSISGKFRQHDPCTELMYFVFDSVHYWEYALGKSIRPYWARYEELEHYTPLPGYIRLVASSDAVNGAQDYAVALKSIGGFDGAMIRSRNGEWYVGASKNGEAIKVKPILSLDLKVCGWYGGKGKHEGRAGGIIVEYRGVKSSVGTGFSDEDRTEITTAPDLEDRIAEIECMGLTDDGFLREPRMKGWRFDTQAD